MTWFRFEGRMSNRVYEPCGSVHSTQPGAPSFLKGNQASAMTRCSATAWAAIFSLVRTISSRLGSKTNNPANKTAADRVLPAPKTPLIAKPVRPSHKANTIALNVASTCPSSRRRSGRMAACKAFSQRTVSIPMANHNSLSAA